MINNCKANSCRSYGTNNNSRNNTSCSRMKLRLQQLEFALDDIVLYLDAYPECNQALEYYHTLLEERNHLREIINEECGPMTNFSNHSKDTWLWTNGPWPWQIEA